jgi:hypothetical protein
VYRIYLRGEKGHCWKKGKIKGCGFHLSRYYALNNAVEVLMGTGLRNFQYVK